MILTIFWDVDVYKKESFLGYFEQEPFKVEAKTLEEAIHIAMEKLKEKSLRGDYTIQRIRKVFDENNILLLENDDIY